MFRGHSAKIMSCKLIFLDVDGTLTLPGENTPPESALNAIQKSKAAGNKIFLCTGRNPDMLLPLLEYNKIFAKSGGLFDGIIASAGGYVSVFNNDNANESILFNLPMSSEQRDMAIDVMHRHGVFCTIEGVTGTWGDENLEEFLKDQPEGNSEIERWRKVLSENLRIRPMSEYDGSPVHKLVIMCREEAQLDEARSLLEKDFKFVIHETPPNLKCINCELINRNFSKGTGVKLIREKFNVDIKDTYGFGDSMNDLDMMNEVGTSVCMENGAEGLKKLVKKICPSIENDGIARAFKDLKLF